MSNNKILSISEATQLGIARLIRPEWSWNTFIELYIFEQHGKRYCGPVAKMVSIPSMSEVILYYVSDAGVTEWLKWSIPKERRVYWDKHVEDKFKQGLWEPKGEIRLMSWVDDER